MKPLRLLLPLSVFCSLFAAPSLAAAADQNSCFSALSARSGGSQSFPAIMARVNGNDGGKSYMESGAKVYNQNILNLRAIPASTPVFVSSLPVSVPSSAKAKAAYKRQKAKEKKIRASMASRSEENLQLLNQRALEDVGDTADERNLAIDRNSRQAYSDLDVLRQCQEWNAETDLINASRAAEDAYQREQERLDAEYLNKTRGAEDQYEKDTERTQDESTARQELCRKDAGGTWVDEDNNPKNGVQPIWGSKNKQIPTSGVVGDYRTNAQGKLTDLGFAKVVVKKVQSNDGGKGQKAVDKVIGSIPAPGSFIDPAEATVTLLVRSNSKSVPGLAKGKWAPAALSAPVIIAKKYKKPKGKPVPKKPKAPSSDAIDACQERESGSAQYGSDGAMDDYSDVLDRRLEDEAIARNKALNQAATTFERTIADAERFARDPFRIAIPYEQAADALDDMIDLQELRSDRQETEEERAVEDASLEARDYLRKALNNPDINF